MAEEVQEVVEEKPKGSKLKIILGVLEIESNFVGLESILITHYK